MILTKKGYELISNAIESVDSLALSKFIFADNDTAVTEDLIELDNIVYENYITNRENISPKEIELQSIIPVWDGGFNINTLGIEDVNKNLIAVGRIPETYVPNIDEGATKEIDITIRITVDSTDNIQIVVDPSITLVTQDKLNSEIENMIHLLDNKVEYSELDDVIEDLIGEAPEALDTLHELAEALGNDPNFATTVTKELGNKVDKEDGKGLSTNDFTDDLKAKLEILQHIEKVSQLKQDIPYLLEKDLDSVKTDINNNTNLINSEIEKVMGIINDIPEVDLTKIELELSRLEDDKANKDDVEDALQAIIKTIEEQLINQLETINKQLQDKADQSEILRLEDMITEIVEGEDSEFILPRVTANPINHEIFYRKKQLQPPRIAWIPDDWGMWEIVNDKHLKVKESNQYDSISGVVRDFNGAAILDIVKTNIEHRHIVRQIRDNKTILETGHVKGNKKYRINVKVGDKITVVSLFEGDVFIEYIGEDDDLRLSVYKNGKIEEVANKRKVEERLEDFTLREEFESKSEDLKEGINNKADKDKVEEDINTIKKEIPTQLSQLENDQKFITKEEVPEVNLTPYLKKDGSDKELVLGKGLMFESNFTHDNWSFINNYTGGGWARGLLNIQNTKGENYLQIGGNGSGQNFTRFYIGKAWNNWNLSINPNTNVVDVQNKLRVNNKDVAIKEDIPNKISQLENDKGFITKDEVPETKVSWGNVTDKPSVFKPSPHTHDNYVSKSGDTIQGSLNVINNGFPVVRMERINGASGNRYGAVNLVRSGNSNPVDGIGIGMYFKNLNSGGQETHSGFFGGALHKVASGSEVGQIVIAPSWRGQDPYMRTDLTVTAKNASESIVDISGELTVNNKDVALKEDIPDDVILDEKTDDKYKFKMINGIPYLEVQ